MAKIHILSGADDAPKSVVVRKIDIRDLWAALARGGADFWAMPSHLFFLGLIYPVAGIGLGALTFSNNALPLLYPLVTGFALIGPFAAVGLYEISRRREAGRETSGIKVFDVLRSPSIPSIVALGLFLMAILIAWLLTAQSLYTALFGQNPPDSYAVFLREVVGTRNGWLLIIVGNLIGFAFAAFVFIISVVSFPLLLGRDVGLAVAVWTSVRAVAKNPLTMTVWAMIIASFLSSPRFPCSWGWRSRCRCSDVQLGTCTDASWPQTSRMRTRSRMRQRHRTMAFEAPPEQPEPERKPDRRWQRLRGRTMTSYRREVIAREPTSAIPAGPGFTMSEAPCSGPP